MHYGHSPIIPAAPSFATLKHEGFGIERGFMCNDAGFPSPEDARRLRAGRLGRIHARQRLAIERDRDVQVFGRGTIVDACES